MKSINIFLLVIIIIIVIIFILSYTKVIDTFNTPYFDCTINLEDIDPRFLSNYMKYDNQTVKCGQCKNSTLHVDIATCPTDINGSTLSSCTQTASIISSQGNPIFFNYNVTPENISKFFCI